MTPGLRNARPGKVEDSPKPSVTETRGAIVAVYSAHTSSGLLRLSVGSYHLPPFIETALGANGMRHFGASAPGAHGGIKGLQLL